MAPSENRNFKEEDDDDEEEYAYDALDSESAPDSLTGGVDSSHHPAADGDSTRDHEETESLRAVGLELAPGSLAQFQTQKPTAWRLSDSSSSRGFRLRWIDG